MDTVSRTLAEARSLLASAAASIATARGRQARARFAFAVALLRIEAARRSVLESFPSIARMRYAAASAAMSCSRKET